MQALARDRMDDRLLAERWAYAQDRLTGDGETALSADVLERTIRWLTAEELAAGEQALADDRPFAAARFLIAADRIDARGTRSALLHATAMWRAAQKSLARAREDADAEPHFQRAERCLRRALPLIARAAADPSRRLECDHLTATAETQLATLERRRSASDRMAAACACLVDYDAFARHLDDQLRRRDTTSFRASLAALGARISRLRAHCPDGSAEARLLTTLAHGVARMQRTLEYTA